MEGFRSSRLGNHGDGAALAHKVPNGSAFGAPPFAARIADYEEIFGGRAASFSIPVLDLPPAASIDGHDCLIDYSEIFGALKGGGFAPYYEDLVAEERRAGNASSGKKSVPEKMGLNEQAGEFSELPSAELNRDHLTSSGNDKVSSNSKYSNISKKHHGSNHRINQRSKVDTINGTTPVIQSYDFPGSTSLAEACLPSHDTKNGHPPVVVDDNLSLNGDLKEERAEVRQEKISTQASSCCKGFENELIEDPINFTKNITSEDSGDLKHHSRSSSYHSTSSGDISYPDYTFITVSDVNLQTQPLPVPPPSRSAPKLNASHSEMKIPTVSEDDVNEGRLLHKCTTEHRNYAGGVRKQRVFQVSMKDSSPHFFDVEVDANSAAAAMKEAMEQAQARLRSAKESMQRKQDNLQGHKQQGQCDVANYGETKSGRAPQEVKSFSEEMTLNTLGKDSQVNYSFTVESKKTRKASKIAPDRKEKGTNSVLTEEAPQTMQGKGSRSSRPSNKLEQRNDEWKVDGQFYQLINNNEKFKMAQEFSEQEGFEKKLISTTMIKKDKENDNKVSKLAPEFKTVQEFSEQKFFKEQLKALAKGDSNSQNENEAAKVALEHQRSRKLYNDESCGWGWNASDLKYTNVVGREEEIKEILEAIPEICLQEENEKVRKQAPGSCAPEENENKLEEALELCEQAEHGSKSNEYEETQDFVVKEKESNSTEEMHVYGDQDEKLRTSDEKCKVEEVNESEGEDKNLVTLKGGCGFLETEQELNAASVAFEPDNSKKVKLANKVQRQEENEKEGKLSYGSCVNGMVDETKAAKEASQSGKLVKAREPEATNFACFPKVHVCELKGISATPEQEESKNSKETKEAKQWQRNEKETEVSQVALELEENEKKLEAAQGIVSNSVNGKGKEAAKGACEEVCNEGKVRDAELEFQQNENNQKASQEPSILENCESKLTADVGEKRQGENDFVKDEQGAISLEKNKRLNADQEVYQGTENQNLDAVQHAVLLANKGNKLNDSLDASESSYMRKTENGTADMNKENERKKEERMERGRKREIDHLRKLEEEREREREREKDRLAVEKATREVHERALTEARERAERIAVERVTAEARQRALAEAREKAERATLEAKSLAEKASREARLRAERAAVERATMEARERAVERALAEKAAAEARERTERPASISKDRMKKDNETEGFYRPSDKEDSGRRLRPTFDVRDASHDVQFQNSAFCSNKSFEGTGGESALRCKARLERHQRTFERAAKALAEKNMRDILAQREQGERERLAEALDADVRRWSNGKEGNLRALLSTLQYILGPESGWQPIPLTDVLTATAVKKAYKKATLYVHPDKLQQRGASIPQKYICEKVFDLLKEAWSRFNSEER